MDSALDRWLTELIPAAFMGAIAGMGFRVVQTLANKERNAEELQKLLLFTPQCLKRDLQLIKEFLELQRIVENCTTAAHDKIHADKIQEAYYQAGDAADQIMFLQMQLENGALKPSYDIFVMANDNKHTCQQAMGKILQRCSTILPNVHITQQIKGTMRSIDYILSAHVDHILALRRMMPSVPDENKT